MSDYTPTTDDVEDAWCTRYDDEHSWASGEEVRGYEAEFNRWLEQTLQEARAEAWDDGKRSGLRQSDWEHGDTAAQYIATNPYRQEKDA